MYLDTLARVALATWLTNFGSHSIIAEERLKDIAQFGIAYDGARKRLILGTRSVQVAVKSSRDFEREIAQRGLGGWLAPGEWWGVNAVDLAGQLCSLIGAPTWSPYFGRGPTFRLLVDRIRGEGTGIDSDDLSGQVRA